MVFLISSFIITKNDEKGDIYMKKEYEEIISKYNGDWGMISQIKYLSEDFIREFKDRVDWESILIYQRLSEDFIREFKDKVDWDCVSEFQILSEDFIREFQDRVNWEFIS